MARPLFIHKTMNLFLLFLILFIIVIAAAVAAAIAVASAGGGCDGAAAATATCCGRRVRRLRFGSPPPRSLQISELLRAGRLCLTSFTLFTTFSL